MIIKDWWYAIKVCRKYGIRWIPRGDGNYNWTYRTVSVNPFRKNFLDVFLHEIGHHVDHRIRNYDFFLHPYGLRYRDTGRNIYRSMNAEGNASRFAAKTGKANKKFLVKMFNTYSAEVFRRMDKFIVVNEFSDIVDCVYRNTRRIEK